MASDHPAESPEGAPVLRHPPPQQGHRRAPQRHRGRSRRRRPSCSGSPAAATATSRTCSSATPAPTRGSGSRSAGSRPSARPRSTPAPGPSWCPTSPRSRPRAAPCASAYSFGTPVIASDTGALGETIRQDGSGWLARPGDARDLADRILEVIDDDEGRHARARHRQAARPGAQRREAGPDHPADLRGARPADMSDLPARRPPPTRSTRWRPRSSGPSPRPARGGPCSGRPPPPRCSTTRRPARPRSGPGARGSVAGSKTLAVGGQRRLAGSTLTMVGDVLFAYEGANPGRHAPTRDRGRRARRGATPPVDRTARPSLGRAGPRAAGRAAARSGPRRASCPRGLPEALTRALQAAVRATARATAALDALRPRLVVLASQHSTSSRSLIHAARERSIPTAYLPHAPAADTYQYRDLPTDFAGLRGAREVDFYRSLGAGARPVRGRQPAGRRGAARQSSTPSAPVIFAPAPAAPGRSCAPRSPAVAAAAAEVVVSPHPRMRGKARYEELWPAHWTVHDGWTADLLRAGPPLRDPAVERRGVGGAWPTACRSSSWPPTRRRRPAYLVIREPFARLCRSGADLAAAVRRGAGGRRRSRRPRSGSSAGPPSGARPPATTPSRARPRGSDECAAGGTRPGSPCSTTGHRPGRRHDRRPPARARRGAGARRLARRPPEEHPAPRRRTRCSPTRSPPAGRAAGSPTSWCPPRTPRSPTWPGPTAPR